LLDEFRLAVKIQDELLDPRPVKIFHVVEHRGRPSTGTTGLGIS
jgi:hypothetical protein